jgi:hypothetical protein
VRLRFFPHGEVDAEQFLERFDFGKVVFADALFLLGRERGKRLAASVAEIPHARPFEQVAYAICRAALQSVHQASRAASEPGAAGSARKRVDVVSDFRPRGELDTLDADQVRHAIQIRLRAR